uniref:Retrovirus-related Pol polyprotein from transposon TNT 1-94 n=1 Tax=Tanacetum cinerariifolium TaxID=118510 RepID=A0A6L2L8F4_TANCI|nr:retrovirus-related Pol polyprotein from transposon TNT 1-94 [Tanacetum cinerariifolium]
MNGEISYGDRLRLTLGMIWCYKEGILLSFDVETSEAKASADKSKVVRKNFCPPLIEDWISDSKDKVESKYKIEKGNPQMDLQDKGVINSGCLRHITGNMSYLTDYEKINKGYVAFGGNPKGGKITSRVVARNQSNGNVGTKACGDVESKSSQDDGFQPSSDDEKKVDEDPRQQSKCKDQEKEDNVNNTNNVNAVGTNGLNVVGANTNNELSFDLQMPALEDISTFNFLSDHEDADEEADTNNMDTTILVSPTPTTRIYKDHLINQDERDIVIRNKARLVTQGHTQKEGLDYDEVFSPVAIIKAIRLFLAYASFKDFVVYQMDVTSAFLYGKIEEEVYVCQPLGFKDHDFPDKVYKVEKAPYGLHQDPKAWYETLSTYLLNNEFHKGKIDKTLFIRRSQECKHTNGNSKSLLKDEDGKEVDVHMYRSMIGSLMYLTSSRPDIMFAVCACAQYQVNLKVSHLHAVKRIFSERNKMWLQIPQQKLNMWLLQVVIDKYYGFKINCLIMWFEQIVDILNANLIKFALTVNPTVYTSCIEQFWATVKAKTVNGEAQLQALVDGKKILITESTVRRDLQLEDAEGVDCLLNAVIFEHLTFYKAFFS